MTRVHAVGGGRRRLPRGDRPRRLARARRGGGDRRLRPAAAPGLRRRRCRATSCSSTPTSYRRPDDLPAGGVLVVGGSASGLQLAQEIHASGRPVTLAVGRHTRMPRRYRGRDIFAWLEAAGITRESWRPGARPRRRPAPAVDAALRQRADRPRALARRGVRVVGRVEAADGARLALGDGLAADCAASDARLARVLRRHRRPHRRRRHRRARRPGRPACRRRIRRAPPRASTCGPRASAASSGPPASVRDHGWLEVPVRDAAGEIVHARRRHRRARALWCSASASSATGASNFIDGVGRDAEALARHLAGFLGARLAA